MMTTRTNQTSRSQSPSWVKALAVCALVLAAGQSAGVSAQSTWTTNGNNINNTNPGNVGVGTATPQSTLHVSSSTTDASRGIIGEQTSADGNSSMFVFRKSRAGGATLETDNIGNIFGSAHDGTTFVTGARFRFTIDGPVATNSVPTSIQFFTGNNASGIERMRISSAGNVGIGIAAPTARFHLVGANGASGAAAPTAFAVTGGVGGNSQTAGGAGGDLSLLGGAGGWNTTGSSFYYSGNGGAISLTGGIGGQHLFGVSHAGTGGAVSITGGTGGAHNVAGYMGGTGGSIVLNGGVGGTGSTPGASGNVILANLRGSVGVGTLTPAHRLDVAGNANASALCINGVCKSDWSQVGGASQWTTGGSNISFSTGNVGIGTTAPAVRFAVGGAGANVYNTDAWVENNMHVQGNETLLQGGRGRLRVGTAWAYTGLYAEASSTGVQNDLVLGAGSGNVRVGPGAAAAQNFIVPNGNVGIGTASPASSRLHLYSPSNTYLRIGAPLAAQSAIAFNDDTNGQDIVLYRPENTRDFAVWTATASNVLRVTQAGNVGVGTNTPGYRFDVQGGQINASGGLCIAGVCKANWSEVGGGAVASGWTDAGASVSLTNASANVGVGTNAPNQKLGVQGIVAAYASPWVQPAGVRGLFMYHHGAAAGLYAYNYPAGSGDPLEISAGNLNLNTYVGGNANPRLSITNAGNVGVGTNAPAAKLHVAGGTRVDGANGRVYQGTSAATGARGLEFIEESPTVFSIRHHDPNVAWRSIALNPHGGSVGVGTPTPDTAVKLHVAGNLRVDGNLAAKYQDLAEWVPSRQQLKAGTVVVLDTEHTNQVVASSRAYDTKVAGVISLQPGIALGEAGEGKLLVATTGRVRIKVDASRGPIKVGDLLVTSDVEGLAMKSVPLDLAGAQLHRPGTIIGKALEPLAGGVGEILVLLSLQ